MNDNFNINNEDDIFTQAFTRSNDPATVASQAARREYATSLANLDAQRAVTNESYGDLFQRAQQSAYRASSARTPAFTGVSGGQVDQTRQGLSAGAISQMGNIGRAREQALRDIGVQQQSAFSNALIAGQQQADYSMMLEQFDMDRAMQEEAIIADPTLSPAAKERLLRANFGYDDARIEAIAEELQLTEETETVPFSERVSNLGPMVRTGSRNLPFVPQSALDALNEEKVNEIINMSVSPETKINFLATDLGITREQAIETYGERVGLTPQE